MEQGVRLGRILSTNFYKVYNDGLFDRLTIARNATRIGPAICVAPACADCPEVLQPLLDIGVDYSKMERYIHQPVTSVVIEILNKLRRSREKSVDKTMHVGI